MFENEVMPWHYCCGWWSPWCWVDELAHWLFPMTFGFYSGKVAHYPDSEPWVCRKHDKAAEKHFKSWEARQK